MISELKIQPKAPIISSDKNISVISELSEFCSFSESLWTEAEKRDDINLRKFHTTCRLYSAAACVSKGGFLMQSYLGYGSLLWGYPM